MRWAAAKAFGELLVPVDRDVMGDISLTTANAYYNPGSTSTYILAGILRLPFFFIARTRNMLTKILTHLKKNTHANISYHLIVVDERHVAGIRRKGSMLRQPVRKLHHLRTPGREP